jgi:hypothetical protein
MSLLATVRPHAWDLPLFLHVLGAMVMVGGFVLALTSLAGAARGGELPITRLGFRALLYAALPGFIVMRGAAEWIASKEGLSSAKKTPTWLDMGYIIADPTLLFLLIAMLLSGLALRRARREGGGAGASAGGGLVRAATILIAIALVGDLVAIFAMTTKPV